MLGSSEMRIARWAIHQQTLRACPSMTAACTTDTGFKIQRLPEPLHRLTLRNPTHQELLGWTRKRVTGTTRQALVAI